MNAEHYAILASVLLGSAIALVVYATTRQLLHLSERLEHTAGRQTDSSLVLSLLRLLGEKLDRDPQNQETLAKYRRLLLIAGPFWGGLNAAEVLAARILIPVAGLLWGLVMGFFLQLPWLITLGLAIVAALVLARLPEDNLKKQAATRQNLFSKQLPGALDLLLISVHSGMDLRGAVLYLAEHYIAGPVKEEFLRIQTDIRLGRSLGESMLDMAARMELPDLGSLCIALSQALETGTSMGQILSQATNDIRKQRLLSAKNEAQKATVSIAFPMLLLIVPGLFIVLLGPVAINMIEHVFSQL